jgi:hypothetical protein
MKKTFAFFLLIIFSKSINAQVNWAEDIAPIIYSKCSNCHNANGIAPFELMNYNDAVQNGNDIRDNVQSGSMPPWPPDTSFNRLAHERILTAMEIADITAWVNNGMPRGDSTLEPPPPVFNNVAEITNPDLVLSAPVYTVNTTDDLYRCFVVPSTLISDKYLTAIEAVPGNRSVVHHILIYSDTSSIPVSLDAADPGPGYTNFGGTGSSNSKLIGIWVPGQKAYFAPTGMGIKLLANTNIILQIHYPGGITGAIDSTKLFLKLTSNFQREIYIDPPLNHFQLDNGPLIIPANTTKTFYAHYNVPFDFSLLGVGPHMHLIGKSIKSFGITPANDTIPFIDIPDWDFHWQGLYSFPKVNKVPAGTIIYSEATYDNTASNPSNPNNPPQLVHLGESTTDEMMLVYFAYTIYLPGDENIIIDSSFFITNVEPIQSEIVKTPQLYDPVPNPVKDFAVIQYFLPATSVISFTVTDLTGKIVYTENPGRINGGLATSRLDLSDLSSGVYLITLTSNGLSRSKKFVKE